MTGANYMGGKRNAMKARAKDTVGRQQKGHFGRQRFDILSKGIWSTKPSEMALRLNRSSAVEIDLAHARKKIPLTVDMTENVNNMRSFIPSPIHITPSTPHSKLKRARRASQAHTSSSAVSTSKVLDALDLSEPLFLRRLMDQIAAMPDLACLSGSNPPKMTSSPRYEVSRTVKRRNGTPKKDKRRKIMIEDENEDPRRKLFIHEEPDAEYPRFSNSNFCTPPQKKQKRPTLSNASHFRVQDTFCDDSSYRACEKERHDSENESDFSDRELLEFDSDDIGHSSSFWSPIHHQRSSGTSVHSEKIQREQERSVIDADVNEISGDSQSSSSDEDFVRFFMEDRPEDEEEYLPSLIALGFEDTKGTRTVYGSLFLQEDPWSTIGRILNLPETDKANALAESKEPTIDVNLESMPEMDQERWGPTATKVNKEWKESIDEYDNHHEVDMESESELQTISRGVCEQMLDDDDLEANSFQDEIMFEYPPSILQDNFTVTEEPELQLEEIAIAASFALDDLAKNKTTVQVSSSPRKYTPGAGQEINVIELDAPDQEYSEGGGKMLGTPELREMNGRFLGPSLFDDFAESDGNSAD